MRALLNRGARGIVRRCLAMRSSVKVLMPDVACHRQRASARRRRGMGKYGGGISKTTPLAGEDYANRGALLLLFYFKKAIACCRQLGRKRESIRIRPG